MYSTVTRIRIVSPAHRATEDAVIDDARPGDEIEIIDRPVYQVDPTTWKTREVLQRFIIGPDRHMLTPQPVTTYDFGAITRAVGRQLGTTPR